MPHNQLGSLSSYAGCLGASREHYDLGYAPGVCHNRAPLPSAFEFDVVPIWPHLGVLIGEAAQTPRSVVLAPPPLSRP